MLCQLGGPFSRRLDHVLETFHGHTGCLSKWHLDDVKKNAVLNFLCGISPEGRHVMQSHLHVTKWTLPAFNSNLLKSTCWLLRNSLVTTMKM